MLEAMASGSIILSTPVGAIPDYINDGETGFIMEDNSPKCIIENVIRVLEFPNLDKIAENARDLVEREFTYEAAIKGWKDALEVI
jgi:glycosyltransferase involved in cell wall biosynthesis